MDTEAKILFHDCSTDTEALTHNFLFNIIRGTYLNIKECFIFLKKEYF